MTLSAQKRTFLGKQLMVIIGYTFLFCMYVCLFVGFFIIITFFLQLLIFLFDIDKSFCLVYYV
jgi:hypothetical protein